MKPIELHGNGVPVLWPLKTWARHACAQMFENIPHVLRMRSVSLCGLAEPRHAQELLTHAATHGVGSPESALASAAAVIPIITPGFKDDPDCKALMTQACHAEVLIAPVLGDPATQPSGWVGLTLASADPLPYSPTKFHPELSPEQQHDAIAALAGELKADGLALADADRSP